MEDEVRDHEPHAALFAPAGDPLFFYRRVAEGAAPLLRASAWIWMEVPHERAEDVLALFTVERGWGFSCLILDLNQRRRVLEARRV
jgi:methylase of polypeptide subunit release factors